MSVTAVPLHPVKKGTLTVFWIGIAVLVAVAALLVWLGSGTSFAQGDELAGGTRIETIAQGEGASPAADDFVLVNYTGKLKDGTVLCNLVNAIHPGSVRKVPSTFRPL